MRNGDDHRSRNMSRIAFVHGRLTESGKERVFETAIVVSMLAVYAVNRFTPLLDTILPFEIAKNHLNDACAGLLFPAYANLLCIAAHSRWRIVSYRSALLLGMVCCFAWEVIAPLIVPWSVGDPIDCLCYLSGSLLYATLRKLVMRGSFASL